MIACRSAATTSHPDRISNLVVDYSRAVQVGPHVAASEVTSARPAGDMADQMGEVLRRIKSALKQMGSALTDGVHTRIHVTDILR
uniref:U1764f n=1 Tax=Mycobacterium leprae TaxID=1769 RepID=Q49987_MYCLR|nr:u1764f [Mycobacterium leprae]